MTKNPGDYINILDPFTKDMIASMLLLVVLFSFILWFLMWRHFKSSLETRDSSIESYKSLMEACLEEKKYLNNKTIQLEESKEKLEEKLEVKKEQYKSNIENVEKQRDKAFEDINKLRKEKAELQSKLWFQS